MANKAIDIIERHFNASGVRRAEELPEESKVHLMRELESFFKSEAPSRVQGEDGSLMYTWESQRSGRLQAIMRWIAKALNTDEPNW
ncbi:MAG: hypothetical protein ACYC2Y_03775 [Armatimonadota bacterium]